MKIKDLSLEQLHDYCRDRESCINCPFKCSHCLMNEYEAEKIRRENIRFLTDKDYEKLGDIEIKEEKRS